jgi:hypothetical protein
MPFQPILRCMAYNSRIDELFSLVPICLELLVCSAFHDLFYPKCELGFHGFSIQNANLQLIERTLYFPQIFLRHFRVNHRGFDVVMPKAVG